MVPLFRRGAIWLPYLTAQKQSLATVVLSSSGDFQDIYFGPGYQSLRPKEAYEGLGLRHILSKKDLDRTIGTIRFVSDSNIFTKLIVALHDEHGLHYRSTRIMPFEKHAVLVYVKNVSIRNHLWPSATKT